MRKANHLKRAYRIEATVRYQITVDDYDAETATEQAVSIPFDNWHLKSIDTELVSVDPFDDYEDEPRDEYDDKDFD